MELILFFVCLIIGGGFLLAWGIGLAVMAGMVILAVIALLWRFIAVILGLLFGAGLLFLIVQDIPLTLSILFGLAVVLWFISENSDKETEVKENNIQTEIAGIKKMSHYR